MQVSEIARELSLSESRLRILFREVAGIPMGAYIQNHRMNQAMSFLKNTDLRLYDVA